MEKNSEQDRQALTHWAAEMLTSGLPPWPLAEGDDAVHTAIAFLLEQGLTALCYDRIRALPHAAVPAAVVERLQSATRLQAAAELLRASADARVLQLFDSAGLRPLVLKGAAYAHNLYAAPYLRPRCDTDLLFSSREEAERALAILASDGYEILRDVVAGRLVNTQRSATKRIAAEQIHALDIHWTVSNTLTFSRALPYKVLESDANSVPELHPTARTLCAHHSLLFACLHLFGENHGVGRIPLIWLYDIHRLAQCLSEEHWKKLTETAVHGKVAAVCASGLQRTREMFDTPIPESALEGLQRPPQEEPFHPDRIHSRFQYMVLDLQSLGHWRQRIRYLKEVAFPPVSYMQHKYRCTTKTFIPFLYIHRGINGIAKKLRH